MSFGVGGSKRIASYLQQTKKVSAASRTDER